MYSKRLGVPLGKVVSTSRVAMQFNALTTSTESKFGRSARMSATAPDTSGVAIEVPLIVLVIVSESDHAAVILLPGAKILTQAPQFEKLDLPSGHFFSSTTAFGSRVGSQVGGWGGDLESCWVVEPTVIALAADEGE